MEHKITARPNLVEKFSVTAQKDEGGSDGFIHLGSAVELTKSGPTGTIDDGEIHGAHRLKQRN